MKITLESRKDLGVSTLRLYTIDLKPNDINIYATVSDDELETIKTLFLKLFAINSKKESVKQSPKEETNIKSPIFDNSKNINKVFKKQSDVESVITKSTKFKIFNYVRVISKNTKMMDHVGLINKIKNNMYNVIFDINTSEIYEEKDLKLESKIKILDHVKFKISSSDHYYGQVVKLDYSSVQIDIGDNILNCKLNNIEVLDKSLLNKLDVGCLIQIKNNKKFRVANRFGVIKSITKDGYYVIDFGDFILAYHKRNIQQIKEK